MDEPIQAGESQRGAVAYEPRDVAWRPVLWVTAATTVAVLAMLLIVAGMYVLFGRGSSLTSPSPPTSQLHSAQQLQVLRGQEDERLSTYGWVSREERVVRIPIDRAIDLWLEERHSP